MIRSLLFSFPESRKPGASCADRDGLCRNRTRVPGTVGLGTREGGKARAQQLREGHGDRACYVASSFTGDHAARSSVV